MAFNFPSAPAIGDLYGSYTWDGEKWTSGTGYGAIYVSDSAPAAPVGSLWFESDTGLLFFRFNDGDSIQWVSIPGGYADAVRYGAAQTLTATQQTQARVNISAAPFEAMIDQNLLINGYMDISQEFAFVDQTITGAHVADQWQANFGGAAFSISGGSASGGGTDPPGIQRILGLVSPAGYAPAGTHNAYFVQVIEGARFAKVGWGKSTGIPISVGFWVYSTAGGVMTATMRDWSPASRSYCIPISVPAATWVYRTATFPPCLDGANWVTTNAGGAALFFSFLQTTSLLAPAANSWLAGNYICAPTGTHMFTGATQSNYITGVTLVPGSVPVSQAQCGSVRRDPATELILCRRYFFYDTYVAGAFWVHPIDCTATPYRRRHYQFNPPMRAAPTATILGASTGTFAAGSPQAANVTPRSCELYGDMTGTGGYSYLTSIKLAARM